MRKGPRRRSLTAGRAATRLKLMSSLSLPAALKELSSRNTVIAATYREWARRLPPGPVSRLAWSIAEQRLNLGKTLGEIAAEQPLGVVEVEFELVTPASAAGVVMGDASLVDLRVILKKMSEAEAADHELLAAVAGAIVPLSGEAAERLASEADSARKRSIWAQDQLELLSML
jgi:hypothetical protein